MQIITKGCVITMVQWIVIVLIVVCIFYPRDIHRNNKDIFESLEKFYIEDKDKLEVIVKDISTIKTRYKAFSISSGRYYILLKGWDDSLDTIHYEIPPSIHNYFRNPQDGFGGMEYVRDIRFSIPSRYRTRACDGFDNAKLTYCFHGVDSLLKDSLYRDYLILDYDNPNIPENRCKLIRILDYNWLIEIRD